MRLSLAVNGQQKVRASLTARGWLGAHVNLSQDVDSGSNDRVWLSAIDISEEPNTTYTGWGGIPLAVGDTVVIEVLSDGESDAPDEVRRTADNPGNLFSDNEQARRALETVKCCDTALQEMLERAKDIEPEDEFRKLALAVGSLFAELDSQLIAPTLRRHPELLQLAKELKVR